MVVGMLLMIIKSWNPYIEPFKALIVHTGGWSGNEEIIVALEMNHVFWSLTSVAQFKGGTYIFTLDVL